MRTLVIRSADYSFYVKYRIANVNPLTESLVNLLDVEGLDTNTELVTGLQTKFKKGLNYKQNIKNEFTR